MANKDLVKRAFSVTANLPVSGPQRRDGASTSEPAEEGANSEAPPTVALPVPDEPVATSTAPKTGPGSMLAFMTEQSEVHREVVRLRERLGEFDGAQATRRIDPMLIKASTWANRDASHF